MSGPSGSPFPLARPARGGRPRSEWGEGGAHRHSGTHHSAPSSLSVSLISHPSRHPRCGEFRPPAGEKSALLDPRCETKPAKARGTVGRRGPER
eukprot:scaffold180710_cov36-Tisochrysis_lutea.AAC.5